MIQCWLTGCYVNTHPTPKGLHAIQSLHRNFILPAQRTLRSVRLMPLAEDCFSWMTLGSTHLWRCSDYPRLLIWFTKRPCRGMHIDNNLPAGICVSFSDVSYKVMIHSRIVFFATTWNVCKSLMHVQHSSECTLYLVQLLCLSCEAQYGYFLRYRDPTRSNNIRHSDDLRPCDDGLHSASACAHGGPRAPIYQK